MCFTPPNNFVYTVCKVTVIPINCTISEEYFALISNTLVHFEISQGESSFKMIDDYEENNVSLRKFL